MRYLKRIGIDGYMLLLVAMVAAGVLLPASGQAAIWLRGVTFWAVALLFFIYGAKLDLASVRAGLMNLRLQGMTFAATYLWFPLLGVVLSTALRGVLGDGLAMGILFLSVLPSTVQSSIAFTSLAGGNVAGAICAASLSNLVAVVLTPGLMALLMHQGGTVSLDAVGRIAVQILLPFLAGQALRRWIGGFIARHRGLTLLVDRGSILLIVYAAFSAGTVAGIWHAVPPVVFVLLGLVIAVWLGVTLGAMTLAGRLSGMPPPDRMAFLFCGSTKSLASGLPIATAIFPAAGLGLVVLPMMLFHIMQLLVCAMLAQRAARRATAAAG